MRTSTFSSCTNDSTASGVSGHLRSQILDGFSRRMPTVSLEDEGAVVANEARRTCTACLSISLKSRVLRRRQGMEVESLKQPGYILACLAVIRPRWSHDIDTSAELHQCLGHVLDYTATRHCQHITAGRDTARTVLSWFQVSRR